MAYSRYSAPPLFHQVILRASLLCSLLCFIAAVAVVIEDITTDKRVTSFVGAGLLPLLIFFGQIRRIWPSPYWLTIFEIVWLMGEIGGCITITFYAIADLGNFHDFIVYLPRYSVPLIAMAVLSGISLIGVFWDIVICRGRNLLKSYPDPKNAPGSGCSRIFGNDVFKRRFSTDNTFIRGIRGVAALLLFLVVTLLTLYLIFINPLQQLSTGSEVRTITRNGHLASRRELAARQQLFQQIYVAVRNRQTLTNSLNVSSIQLQQSLSVKVVSESNTADIPCDLVAAPTNFTIMACPFSLDAVVDEESVDITFDFSAAFPGFNPALPAPLIRLYVGFTDNAESLVASTPPIYVFPGSSAYVIGSIVVREKHSGGHLATLGVPLQLRRFALINDITVFSRSDAQSPLQANNNTGSFRLVFDDHSLTQLEREYTERSVVEGFATLGGIWTFINGVFAAFFGSTLLLVLFERKPLSIYGLVHAIRGKGGLHLEKADELSPEMQRRIVNLLHKHLMDTGRTAEDFTGDKAGSMSPLTDRPLRKDTDLDMEELLTEDFLVINRNHDTR